MRLITKTVWALFATGLGSGLALTSGAANAHVTEAPTGFDTQTNGFVPQFRHKVNRLEFEEQETNAEGLGPVYTARACADCHGSPVTGGVSQVNNLFAGHLDATGKYTGATVELGNGTSLSLANIAGFIAPRAICPEAVIRLPEDGSAEPIRVVHIPPSTLGDGFVEAIDDATLLAIRDAQPGQSGNQIKGEATFALIFEAGFVTPKFRVGRFGWKSTSPTLLTFAAGSYLGDLGITNRLLRNEIVSQCDTVPDPEDSPEKRPGNQGLDKLTAFMRATKAPPRDKVRAATAAAQTGEQLFDQIGCGICHVSTIQTAPPGTVINGGTFTVPRALGDKIIHPYSDFLLHDVGTGDGLVPARLPVSVANKLRTAPLWGVRVRPQLMHDGESVTFSEAILRHAGEATGVIDDFKSLNATQQGQLIEFLKSL